ncbi:MAG: RibD family protein, partial [Bacteroidota bacterium]
SYPYFQPAARVAQARQLYAGQDRPFVLLKYAQSADGFLAPSQQGSYWITSDISRRMVHFWRSRTRAIVVGAGTILADNPQLNTRLYPGPSPLPIIIDLKGEIRRTDFRVFQRAGEEPPILVQPVGIQALDHCDQVVFPVDWLDEIKHWDFRRCQVIASTAKSDAAATKKAAQAFVQKLVSLVMQELHHRKHNHLTVEGGSSILQLFLLANCWDEARVFTGQTTYFTAGLTAPRLPGAPIKTYSLGADQLSVWLNDDSFLT